MKRLFLVVSMGLFAIMACFAQNQTQEIFPLDTFIQRVKAYHPFAKQSDIQVDMAIAELLAAKGSFDPALELDASRKTFDGKNYYYYSNPQLTLPLPVGNIKTGTESNGGDFITSEVTKGKTSYAGLEIPLAKGLLLDKRRSVLQQAKIFRNQSEQERLVMFNNLLFESYVAYWQWATTYWQHMAYSKYIEAAENRMRLVRIAFTNGDRAMSDTVEAYTQMQTYQLLQAEALLNMNNAKLELANYLWLENYNPYELPGNYIPESLQFTSNMIIKNVDNLLAQSASQNPVLQIYRFKLNSLEVERKLKYQGLLPYFSVKANLLSKDYYALKNLNINFIQNNYRWGLDFSMPLFLRQARGEYKKTQLKIKETQLELINKLQQTDNKIRSYYNECNALITQLQTIQSMFSNYQFLLRSEELKFSQGESSLFLVNSRETKLIELLQKQIELTGKYYKARYALQWAAGALR